MHQFACPSCGAPVVFQSAQSVFATCSYCRSTIVRRDVDVEAIGKVAQLTEDLSPFQVGTTSEFNRRRFTICGRVRMAWQDGMWNEWYVLFEDGDDGWLAEAQGFYAINFPTELPMVYVSRSADPHAANGLVLAVTIGQTISLADRDLTVVDLKQAVCVGCEGELPRVVDFRDPVISADLVGQNGSYGCIEIRNSQASAFIGRYLEWDELKAANYRQFEGWS